MATAFSDSITTVTTLADLYKKTNTDVQVALKRVTEEYNWLDEYPDEMIEASGNEMRLVLDVNLAYGGAFIPDGGYEDIGATAAPTHGTLSISQFNKRFYYTGLAKALDSRARASMIQRQTQYQSIKAIEILANKIGVSSYGFSTGTVAVVEATGSSGTTHTSLAIKNAFGSTTVAGGTTAQDTYLSNLFRVGEGIAFIRSGSLVEFGTITASPGTAGVGTIDLTTNGTMTPTVGDLILYANATTDATLTATDQNRWQPGWLDMLTSSSLHGLATSSAQNWQAGYANTAGGRMTWATQEAMANGLWNKGGVKMNKAIYSQGVRRDIIAGERAAIRWEGSNFDWDADFGTKGFKYYTSQLALPGFFIGWNDQCVGRKYLSDKPDYDAGPGIFSIDKVQDRSAWASAFDFFFMRICNNRAGIGYASALTEQ